MDGNVVQVEMVQRSTPVYQKRRSTIWRHFTLNRDEGTSSCNYCHRAMTYNVKTATTSNLLKHVQSKHPEMLSDAERERVVQERKPRLIKLENYNPSQYEMLDHETPGPYVDPEMEEEYLRMEKPQIKRHFTPKVQYKVEYYDTKPKPNPNVSRIQQQLQQLHRQSERSPAGGQIEQINKRLDRIEGKIDLLLNFLVGEHVEPPVQEDEYSALKFERRDNYYENYDDGVEIIDDTQEEDESTFYQFGKVNNDEEMAELSKKLDHQVYVESLRDYIKEKSGEDLCNLRELFTEKYLNQHSFGWSIDKKDIQSNPLYLKIYKYLKSQQYTDEEITTQAKREMSNAAMKRGTITLKRKADDLE